MKAFTLLSLAALAVSVSANASVSYDAPAHYYDQVWVKCLTANGANVFEGDLSAVQIRPIEAGGAFVAGVTSQNKSVEMFCTTYLIERR